MPVLEPNLWLRRAGYTFLPGLLRSPSAWFRRNSRSPAELRDVLRQHLPEDDILDDDREPGLVVRIGGLRPEAVAQAELPPRFWCRRGGHLLSPGNDHPPERVASDVHSALEPPRQLLSDRRLPSSRDASDENDRRASSSDTP